MLYVTSKQISVYESGKLPPLDKLLDLCDIFDCELGYLLGEKTYSQGSKIETLINEKTGLSKESMQVLEYITSSSSRFHFRYDADKFRELLNKIFTCSAFIPFIEAMFELSEQYSALQKLNDQLNSSFDKVTLDQAHQAYYGSADYEHDPSLPEPTPEVIQAYKMIDEVEGKGYALSFSEKIAKYELNESFIMLINTLFKNDKVIRTPSSQNKMRQDS